MKIRPTRQITSLVLGAVAVLAFTANAHAIPIVATFAHQGNTFSFVRDGATPQPAGPASDYLRFGSDATVALDLTGTDLTLDGGAQSYVLESGAGALATFDILDLNFDLNDVDGFLNGSIDYALNGVLGTFLFTNDNYGSFAFNSSSLNGSAFELFGWGGDIANDLSIDFAITTVPAPATVLLIGLGVVGIFATRRKRA